MADLEEELEEELEEGGDDISPNPEVRSTSETDCSICLESTDDPRHLPCGHLFCLQCLESLWYSVVEESMMTTHGSEIRRNTLRCPNCRRDVKLPQGGPLNLPSHDDWLERKEVERRRNTMNYSKAGTASSPDIPGHVEECRIHVEMYHASSHLELPMLKSMMDHPLSLYKHKRTSVPSVHASIQTIVMSSISSLDLEEKEAQHDTVNDNNYRHLPWSVEKFDNAYDVVFLPGSKMAVTDQDSKSVTIYGPHGSRLHCTLDHHIELTSPHRLTYHPQRDVIIVCEFLAKTLCILSRDLREIRRRIKLDSRPLGIAVMHNNHLVISSRFMYGSGSGMVMVMTYQGVILHSWHDGLGRPSGVAVDKDDNIYVCDTDNHRIVTYTGTGKRLRQFGNWSTMNSPRAVCSTADGHILVAHNSRVINTDKISMWSSDGRELGHLLEMHRGVTNQKMQGIDMYKNRLAVVYNKKLVCQNLDRLPLLYDDKKKRRRRKKWIAVFIISIIALAILLIIILVTTHELHIE